VDADTVEQLVADIPRERAIVVVCGCPNEAQAANVAARLRSRGYRRAWPLEGGFVGWPDRDAPTAATAGV